MSNSEGDITSRLRARPLKRKRVNDSESEDDRGEPANSNESPSADTEWKHHDKYYFDDGNVVLLAEDTIFRVHKSVLTLHSGLFQDMLSLPQSEGSDSETMDGCPLVRTQDLALHITWLLEAMYNGATTEVLDKNRPLAKDIERLHHLSRIGDKYAVQALVDHVYQKLVMLFPVGSLSSWRPRKFLAQKELLLIIEMIRLWHPNAVHLLPIIFYAYCQLPLDEIGMTHEGEPNQLSPEDMKRCLAAIPKLLARKIEICNVFTSLTRTSQLCPSPLDCVSAFSALSNTVLKRGSMARLPCPLEDLVQWCNSDPTGKSFWSELCEDCAKEVEQSLNHLRVVTWNNLGKTFDIPEWQAPPKAQ